MTEGLGQGAGAGYTEQSQQDEGEVRSQSAGFSEGMVRSATGLSQGGTLISCGPYKHPR